MGFRKVKTPNWEIPFADDTIKLAILRCYLIVPACLPAWSAFHMEEWMDEKSCGRKCQPSGIARGWRMPRWNDDDEEGTDEDNNSNNNTIMG